MILSKEQIANCCKGDQREISELYDALFSFIMNISMRYKLNYDDAGASTNSIFIKFLGTLEGIDNARSVLPLVKTIAVRHLVDEYRATKRKQELISDQELSNHINLSGSLSSDADLNAEDLLKMIRSLPEPTATVFNLYVVDGYKHKEIADMLGLNEGNSKWHLNKARNMLKAMLIKEKDREKNWRYG